MITGSRLVLSNRVLSATCVFFRCLSFIFFFLPSSAPSLLFSHPMIRITNTLSGQKEMKKRVGSLKRKHEKVFYIFIITNNALFSAGARFRADDFCHHPATATGDSEATRNLFSRHPPVIAHTSGCFQWRR